MSETWEEANTWEKQWWGNCSNTYNEETKQYIYSDYMLLNEFKTDFFGQVGWDFKDKSVLDIGGGPSSILLKCKAKNRTAIDPCNYPAWVSQRYEETGVRFINKKAEDLLYYIPHDHDKFFDLCLIYNCLQHTENPELIISNAKKVSKEIRIFEWIEKDVSSGHIQLLTEEKLNLWLGGSGKVSEVNNGPCTGLAYSGVFV